MKKIALAALSMLFSASLTYGQTISFEKKEHHFGTFPEESGKVSYEFAFTNTGETPLVLNKVAASCGCTTPEWTKEPVAPGKSGKIEVTYNAQGRPGAFGKTVTVYSNSTSGTETLLIKGEVTAKSKNPETAYPFSLDNNILTNKKEIKLPSIKNNETKKEVFSVFNNTDSPLEIKCNTQNSKFITVQENTIRLTPKTAGQFTLEFNGANVGDFGPIKEFITIEPVSGTTNAKSDKNRVNVLATVVENFDSMTKEDWDNAPIAQLSMVMVDFKEGVRKEKIEIKNTGKTPLKIRKVAVDNDLFSVAGGKDVVKPGSSAAYTITVKDSAAKGKASGAITFVTNDPSAPLRTVKVVADL